MSQGSLVNPTSGTLSGLSLVDNLNLAFDALVTMNSGAAPPANAASPQPAGQLWLNTSVAPWLVQISDGTDWLTIGFLDSVNHIYTPKGPTGSVIEYYGSDILPGTIQPYGQTLLIASYPALYAKLGTTFGGDGLTTFGVPDRRGRGSAALDNLGGTAAGRLTSAGSGIIGTTLGAAGGSETYALVTGELASHSHAATDSGHSHIATDSGHTHPIPAQQDLYGSGVGSVWFENTGETTGIGYANITVATGHASISVATAGSGAAHQNTQPTIVCNALMWT
jgi:microcystin-dependent protein